MSDLPPGWEWATLGEIALSVKNGIFVSRPGSDPDGVPILRISAVRAMRLELDVRYTGLGRKDLETQDALLNPRDLLFTRYSGNPEYVGACAQVPRGVGDLAYPDKLIRVRVPSVDSRYVAAAFASPAVRSSVAAVLRTTAGQVGISGSALKSIRIPVAPLAEQQRIVDVLEGHLSRLDAGNNSTAIARKCRSALIDSLREAELIEVANDSSGGCLGDAVERIEAGRSFGGAARRASEEEWGIIKVSAMTWGEFRESENKVLVDTAQVDRRFEIRPGDILVSRANTKDYVGAAVMVGPTRPKLLLSDKSLRLVPKQGIDPRWLVEILSSPTVRRQISKMATGNQDSMRNISQTSLLNARIPLVDLDRQRQQVAVLVERLSAVQHLDASLVGAARSNEFLRRSLLADAFAGRLVPQNPTDEPASVLLERIRAERTTAPKPKRARRGPRLDPAQEILS